jgi:predicted DNA-binding transcriptional regulator AlpA
MNHPQTEPWLTSRDVAALLHRSNKTIERAARRDEIPAHKKLGRWYFLASEINNWIRGDLQCGQPVRTNGD